MILFPHTEEKVKAVSRLMLEKGVSLTEMVAYIWDDASMVEEFSKLVSEYWDKQKG